MTTNVHRRFDGNRVTHEQNKRLRASCTQCCVDANRGCRNHAVVTGAAHRCDAHWRSRGVDHHRSRDRQWRGRGRSETDGERNRAEACWRARIDYTTRFADALWAAAQASRALAVGATPRVIIVRVKHAGPNSTPIAMTPETRADVMGASLNQSVGTRGQCCAVSAVNRREDGRPTAVSVRAGKQVADSRAARVVAIAHHPPRFAGALASSICSSARIKHGHAAHPPPPAPPARPRARGVPSSAPGELVTLPPRARRAASPGRAGDAGADVPVPSIRSGPPRDRQPAPPARPSFRSAATASTPTTATTTAANWAPRPRPRPPPPPRARARRPPGPHRHRDHRDQRHHRERDEFGDHRGHREHDAPPTRSASSPPP
jgi:hypothetical protein